MRVVAGASAHRHAPYNARSGGKTARRLRIAPEAEEPNCAGEQQRYFGDGEVWRAAACNHSSDKAADDRKHGHQGYRDEHRRGVSTSNGLPGLSWSLRFEKRCLTWPARGSDMVEQWPLDARRQVASAWGRSCPPGQMPEVGAKGNSRIRRH